MARRSARLASVSKTSRPSATTPSLASLAEREESPSEPAVQSLDALVSSPASPAPSVPVPQTPADTTPIKPAMSEMHPSKAHQTMAPPSSGLRLGFTDIQPAAERNAQLSVAAQSTPTKISMPPLSSPFTFRFGRETPSDLKLGPEAQRMMEEIRKQAMPIKAEMADKRESQKVAEEQVNGRKYAKAKGKAGRYSAAHIAQFKKMDSIQNHPSAFRANGRTTPLAAGIKRSPSKANLDDTDTAHGKQSTPSSTVTRGKKRANEDTPSPVKRAKQYRSDDASSNRPVSRDGSFLPVPRTAAKGGGIPRSKSSLASLMTPTKASLNRAASVNKTSAPGSPSPTKPALGGLTRSATTNKLEAIAREEKGGELNLGSVTVRSPSGRFDKVKSLLRGQKSSPMKAKSAIPLPSSTALKAASSLSLDKELPGLPSGATPNRKPSRRVAFTPETTRMATAQHTPSPIKSGIPRSKSRQILSEVHYPALDSVISEDKTTDDTISYPNLFERRPLPEPPVRRLKASSVDPADVPAAAAGTFTFRSDHTIRFGSASPTSFGSSPGQASLRQVPLAGPPVANMPGSFPASVVGTSSSSDKENKVPGPMFPAVPHGMPNKKRHRVSTDEEDAELEAAERAAKKRKQEAVPEGDALMAPRLLGASGKKTPSRLYKLDSPRSGTAIPSPKKKSMLSLSRLHMLARPKLRK